MQDSLYELYDPHFIVQYSNNQEYRDSMRQLFKMKLTDNTTDNDIDDETLDEQNYDNERTTIMLDYVYAFTKDNPIFQELYQLGAATMLSLDPEIGLAVLFSYDYFYFFHQCICSFIKKPQSMNISNEYFIELKSRFQK